VTRPDDVPSALHEPLIRDSHTMTQAQAIDPGHPASPRQNKPGLEMLPALNHGDKNLNPLDIGFLAVLREDLHTYDNNPFDPGFWAVALHRYGNWRMAIRPKVLRAPFSLTYRILFWLVELVGGIHLPYTVRLGRRVRIWHHGGIVLHARSIGDDVHIRHNTTFGIASRSQLRAIPTIEQRVDIGCGACVLGNVTVGHDSQIGANAVVVADIPPYSTAVGVPARVIKRSLPEHAQ
jgi:serine O-acetyltransferase